MAILSELQARADGKCELCGAGGAGEVYPVPPGDSETVEKSVLLCGKCVSEIGQDGALDVHHWRALNESMWSEVPAVQVMAWRMLQRLDGETWARELADMLYLDDEVLAWARAGMPAGDEAKEAGVRHVDSNGVELAAGDAVVIIKDLNVKGTSFVAKRGTAVRGIRLVPDNPTQIEGRVNGQQIVILTEFVKKS